MLIDARLYIGIEFGIMAFAWAAEISSSRIELEVAHFTRLENVGDIGCEQPLTTLIEERCIAGCDHAFGCKDIFPFPFARDII